MFYEVFLRSFYDSSGDGNGDLRGLMQRLDHLEWLGIDCLWLLPFYTSPLRDGGYDISDFFTIQPVYGAAGRRRGAGRRGPPPRHAGRSPTWS